MNLETKLELGKVIIEALDLEINDEGERVVTASSILSVVDDIDTYFNVTERDDE